MNPNVRTLSILKGALPRRFRPRPNSPIFTARVFVRSLAELAKFNDNQGHVICQGTMSPASHAVQDCLLTFMNRQPVRFEDQSFKAFDPEHVVEVVKNLDEPVGVKNQTITG